MEQIIFSSWEAIKGSFLDYTSNNENLRTASGFFDLMSNDREILD